MYNGEPYIVLGLEQYENIKNKVIELEEKIIKLEKQDLGKLLLNGISNMDIHSMQDKMLPRIVQFLDLSIIYKGMKYGNGSKIINLDTK